MGAAGGWKPQAVDRLPESARVWPSRPPDSRPPSPVLLQTAAQSSSCQQPATALHHSRSVVLKESLHLRQKSDHPTSLTRPGTAEQHRASLPTTAPLRQHTKLSRLPGVFHVPSPVWKAFTNSARAIPRALAPHPCRHCPQPPAPSQSPSARPGAGSTQCPPSPPAPFTPQQGFGVSPVTPVAEMRKWGPGHRGQSLTSSGPPGCSSYVSVLTVKGNATKGKSKRPQHNEHVLSLTSTQGLWVQASVASQLLLLIKTTAAFRNLVVQGWKRQALNVTSGISVLLGN